MKKTFNDCVILFGGSSEERLVSVASAQNLSLQIPEASLWFLNQAGQIFEIETSELQNHKNPFMAPFIPKGKNSFSTLKDSLLKLKHKTVIIALHGTEGEDGTLQKLFEDHNIAFTGTKSKASADAFNKVTTKLVARKNNLSVVEELIIDFFTNEDITKLKSFLKQHKKLVLKPLANGSSVGLFIVSSESELDESLKTIKNKNLSHYLIEPFITGREITVGVRQKADGSTIPIACSEVRVIQGRQFDYEGKYLGSGVEELTPAPITAQETKECQDMAIKIHNLLGCRGYSRTDMILTEKGPILLEINTLPGLSKASFVPQQIISIGGNLRDFFQEQINLEP